MCTKSRLLLGRLKYNDRLSSDVPDQSGKHRMTPSQKLIIGRGYSKYIEESTFIFYTKGLTYF